MSDTIWMVYELRNASLRKIYYGVSKTPGKRITTQHCVGLTKALKHWDCDQDAITANVVAEYDNQREASAHAHALERQTPPGGWTIIPTAGV
jgi:predicted GIY-YIG superfamily endonuclease